MKTNEYGQVTVTEQEAFEALYSGNIKTLEDVCVDCNVQQFNSALHLNADNIPELKSLEDFTFVDKEFFDESNQCNWFMPKEYLEFPIHQWLLDQCTSDIERTRVTEELELFIQHNMFDLLSYLKYLVDTFKQNKVVWGVGRGSSVASYVLYLLGVHRINSIKYNLDIHEFLKES